MTDKADPIIAEALELDRESQALDAHLERLNREVIHAVAHHATFERLNEHARSFPRSFAAHAFNLTVGAHRDHVVLALGRLWDIDKDSYSIPAFVKRSRRFGVRLLIAERLASAHRGAANSQMVYSESIPIDVRKRIEAKRKGTALEDAMLLPVDLFKRRDSIAAEVNRFVKSKTLRHLNEMRNRFLAHSTEISRAGKADLERGIEVRTPMLEELRKMVQETTEIVGRVQLLHKNLVVGYELHADAFRENVDDWIKIGFGGSSKS
jgi:hypothetical protein